jgi:hypothetical protein
MSVPIAAPLGQRAASEPPQTRPGRSAIRQSLLPYGVSWVAAHGGAGTSSLTGVLGGTDLGCRWPDAARGEPARVLLVARTHAAGLQAASQALNSLREGRHPPGMSLVALVLVADAPGRLPFTLGRRIRVLRSVVPVRRVPWIAGWRIGKPPKNLPKQLLGLGELAGADRGGDQR